MQLSSRSATAIGLLAPVSWGLTIGIVRTITESFGLGPGLALCYLVTAVFLFFLIGLPDLKKVSRKYLFLGIPCANLCSICLCMSLWLASDVQQTVELGMINYLWPCFVVVFAVLFNGQFARWWLLPGTVISLAGIWIVLGADRGVSPATILNHVLENPLCYFLAFAGAVLWGLYSNATRAWANGQNPSCLIFIVNVCIFSLLWLCGLGSLGHATTAGWISIALGAVANGGAYAAWTFGVMRGSIAILSIASYFTPVLSCLFSAIWLDASLSPSFWKGVGILVLGSLLCWLSTVEDFRIFLPRQKHTDGKEQ